MFGITLLPRTILEFLIDTIHWKILEFETMGKNWNNESLTFSFSVKREVYQSLFTVC